MKFLTIMLYSLPIGISGGMLYVLANIALTSQIVFVEPNRLIIWTEVFLALASVFITAYLANKHYDKTELNCGHSESDCCLCEAVTK